ncbi:MAG: cytochrome c3 family protein [Chloroflexi bacterium]|nr:cytochrome c3 family protein [Chloroflexota bacterium]
MIHRASTMWVRVLLIALLLVGLSAIVAGTALAQDAEPEATPEGPPQPSNAYCLLCHSAPDQTWSLPSGETLSLTIDPAVLAGSVHGDRSEGGALACADCHPGFTFPHPVSTAQSIRGFRIERYAVCRTCHEDQYTRAQDSVHGAALRSGQLEAATCVDCHGGHDIQTPNEPRQRVSLTCGRCHGAIFEEYQNSIHGSALLDEDNADVPTCTNCHGVHDIQNPATNLARVRSPQLCAECHADTELMAKYDISTHVFESYLTDFHGSTIALFEQQDPTVATNKPVCYDCHSVHSIKAMDEEGQASIREHLVETCAECHPGASASFPDAWIGHYPSTPENHPVLYASHQAYNLLVPGVLGVLALAGLTEVIRRLLRRGKGA